jgi:hypothetical protein
LLRNVTEGLGIGRILWNDLGNEKWVRDLREMGCEGVDWIHVVQDRDQWRAVVNTVMNLRVPYKAGNFLTE